MQNKGSTFYSVILRPRVLARLVIEPGPNAPTSGTQPIEPTSRQLILEDPASLIVVSGVCLLPEVHRHP